MEIKYFYSKGRSALFKMSAELDNDKRARAHRIPVAATSMIALASATGQHIFRKKTGRKTAPPRLSIDADAGVPLTHASGIKEASKKTDSKVKFFDV